MNTIRACVNVAFPDYSLAVNLELPGQGITALFGPSGAGKTTLLRAIAGLERAHDSCIRVDGQVWQDDAQAIFLPTHRRAIGFVFQDVLLFEHLDVRRNLEFGMKRVPLSQRTISLDHAVDLLGIKHLMQRQSSTLSGGERQRVGIARALATSPRVLLLDEPLAALDMQRKHEIMPYLERLSEHLKIPMLYVSHALDEVAQMADHIVLLEGGRVRVSDTASSLLTRLDMPLAHGDAAAAVISGHVVEHDPEFQLACVEFSGGRIFLPNDTIKLGQPVRLRIQARDVSLTLERQSGTSILNILRATVVDLSDDALGQVMVGLDAGGTRLLCRITRKSASALGLEPGKSLFAQVKGVAVL